MKKQISKFNYIIMFAILIVLTASIFLIAFLVSSNTDKHKMQYETVISTNEASSGKNVGLFSSAISESGSLDGSGDFDIETVEVGETDEIDYDFPDDDLSDDTDGDTHTDDELIKDDGGLSIYHRPYDESDLEDDDDTDTVVIDDDTDDEPKDDDDDDTDTVVIDDEPKDDDEPKEEYLHNKSGDLLLFEEGRDYYIDDYFDEALKTLRKMIRLYPTSPYVPFAEIYIGKSLIGRGMETDDRNDFIRSNDLLEEDLKEVADNPDEKDMDYMEELVDFIVVLSDSNRNLGIPNEKIESKLEDILKSVSMAEAKEHINTSLGYLKMFRGDHDNAVSNFKESTTDLSQIGLSKAYLELGEFDKALEIWAKFITEKKISYYYPDAMEMFKKHTLDHAHELFNENRYTESIRYYTYIENYFDDTEEQEEALYYKGVSFFNIKRKEYYDKALSNFNAVLKNRIDTYDSYALFYKGKTQIQTGRLLKMDDPNEETVNKINIFESALSNLVKFTERYANHPYNKEANALIEYLRRQIINLQS